MVMYKIERRGGRGGNYRVNLVDFLYIYTFHGCLFVCLLFVSNKCQGQVEGRFKENSLIERYDKLIKGRVSLTNLNTFWNHVFNFW